MSQKLAQNVPSTQQAVAGLDQAQNYLDNRAQQGGAGAQRTVADINQALNDAKDLVKQKDLGDAVSKLVNDVEVVGQQASQTAKSNAQNLPSAPGAPSVNSEDSTRLSRDAHEAANQIRRAAQLTVTSPAFRRFLWNYYTLFRDTFGPQVDRAVEQRLKEGRKDDLTIKAEQQASQLKQTAQQQGGQARSEAESAKNQASEAARQSGQALKQGDAKTAVTNARDQAQQLTQKAKETWNTQLTPERREELAQRWQNLRREVEQDPNLRQALNDLQATIRRLREDVQPLLNQANQKAGEIKQKAQEASQQAKNAGEQTDTTGLRQVVQDARELVEKFAEGRSLQPLVNALTEWSNALQNDQQLRQWANDIYDWTSATKRDADKINDDQHLQQLNQLIDQGRSFTQGQHRQIAEELLDQSRDYLYAIRNDAATNRLRGSLNNVVQDLFVDSEGRFVVKPDVYNQLAKSLAPSFADVFKDIRIAHVEEHNEDMDFALDNIVIDASDIQPDQLDVTSVADVSLGKKDTGADLRFKISAKGINPSIKNAYFRYERHSFPKLSDFGTLDAALTKDGLSFNVDIEFTANERDRTFKDNDITVSMKGLKLDFQNAKHETLYKIFKPLIVSRVTKQMEQTIKEQIHSFVQQFDEAATNARFKAADTIQQAAGDRIVRGVDNNVGQAPARN